MSSNNISVIIPVFKPKSDFRKNLEMIFSQSIKPFEVIIILTDTGEEIKELEKFENIKITKIKKEEFNHANTRNLGASISKGDYLLFMTQDATPKDVYLFENLLNAFNVNSVACAYARQLPRDDCNIIEKYARFFNYPKEEQIKDISTLNKEGITAIFNSNVCCMYKREAFEKVGGFPKDTVFNEDSLIAYSFITNGYSVYYKSDALVYHSHNYTISKIYSRYVDLGISHELNKNIYDKYPSESRGVKLLIKTCSFLIKDKKLFLIPKAIWVNGLKFTAYKIGRTKGKRFLKSG